MRPAPQNRRSAAITEVNIESSTTNKRRRCDLCKLQMDMVGISSDVSLINRRPVNNDIHVTKLNVQEMLNLIESYFWSKIKEVVK